jgi:hypothetical protein
MLRDLIDRFMISAFIDDGFKISMGDGVLVRPQIPPQYLSEDKGTASITLNGVERYVPLAGYTIATAESDNEFYFFNFVWCNVEPLDIHKRKFRTAIKKWKLLSEISLPMCSMSNLLGKEVSGVLPETGKKLFVNTFGDIPGKSAELKFPDPSLRSADSDSDSDGKSEDLEHESNESGEESEEAEKEGSEKDEIAGPSGCKPPRKQVEVSLNVLFAKIFLIFTFLAIFR